MRKLGIFAVVLIALIILVIVVVPLVLDINHYHGLVQAQLEKALGRPVTFGQMHLSLTPPSVRMDNLVIGEAPQFASTPFATAGAIEASVKLLPLLHKDVQINSVDLKNPKVQLIRNAQGVWNFSTLGPQQQQAKQPSGQDNGGGFVLSNLKITDGQVTLVDNQKNFRGVYNNIDVTLHGFAPGKPFDFSAALHLPGTGKQTLALSGTTGPINQADMLKTPFNGKLELRKSRSAEYKKSRMFPRLTAWKAAHPAT